MGAALTAALFLFPAALPAQDWKKDSGTAAERFRQTIDSLLDQSCQDGLRVGAKFYSLDRNKVLYSRNSDTLFTPASNMKMFTSAMALKKVGPDYRFHTRLYTNGQIRGGVLKGNLYIKGFGDPSLVTEQMWILVNELKNLPIIRVQGNIIADNSYFEGEGRLKTWKPYRGPEAYLAPVGALSFNFNTVTVHIEPGPTVGSPPLVVVDPNLDYFRVVNRAVTTARKKRRRPLIVTRRGRRGHDEILIKGTLPKYVARKKYYLNVTRPTQYTATAFKKYLEQAGVRVTGKIVQGEVPAHAKLLLDHESPPLADILRGLNKFSNNFMAEQILIALAAQFHGEPGTTENGVLLLQEYMQGLGYAVNQYRMVDGSGLSKENLVTPDQIVSLLQDAHEDLSIFPEFISALGVMGLDGSVVDRMHHSKEAQRIRVKTGTLNHVSALSGYYQSLDGERFAFSILLNDLKCSNGTAMKLEDRMMEIALQFHREEGEEDVAPELQWGGGILKRD
ncbi:MAG: D-alanyl-D-alanine carboxypeptidase/D-alanyl-D-alanine-endopeptidase [Nitrospinaceae bacterium]|nr:D-alanyl-D-alanine carboxypeptidase/D-alanyl-D-alanine-endopeptidase [Nitrospinaceae bacterium]NIR57339.1 D-alanyl-D-alanine carboxypeptidase/D-alanyl-D-alanine-endopeptidase [Nitrospinaceae bacterium]NIS87791.1 D-alanyl-D-alanine carboxypeptidase/D-alanyl-D-alanine-endopeptidase [Nitrospinaceae bacterium]NIT84661.1 D-alanyl-D-alanine carboxypeptidase/D-alanyl-D-alanine-endopeptidase [Nitrospinaceae bacterium]NIU46840.1 D-alanyl-D-alanine carboxypeptidase/D-alanyl-D-alanine-endopeptidase [Ni